MRFGLVCTSVCVCFCLCLCVCLAQQVLLPYERTLYKEFSGSAAVPRLTLVRRSLGPRGLDSENWVGGRGESKRWRGMGSRGRQTRMPAVTQPFVRFCFVFTYISIHT